MLALTEIRPEMVDELSIEQTVASSVLASLSDTSLFTVKRKNAPDLKLALGRLPTDLQSEFTGLMGRLGLFISDEGATCACAELSGRSADLILRENGFVSSSCPDCSAESVAWKAAPASQAVRSIRSARTELWRRGEAREVVYARNIEPLITGAGSITVVDRYAGGRAIQRRRGSGLCWLLQKLEADKPGMPFTLLTAHPAGIGAGAGEPAFKDIADFVGRSYDIWTQEDRYFRDLAHDRYFIANYKRSSIGVSLGKGVEVFEKAKLSQALSAQFFTSGISRVLDDLNYSGTDASQIVST